MNPLLIFPPGWTPVGPYLALPILKSYLEEKENFHCDIIDLNVEFYDEILSTQFLDQCMLLIEAKIANIKPKDVVTYNLVKESILQVHDAKSIIRSKIYYDYRKRSFAENILKNCFFIINLAFEDLSIDFNNIEFIYSYKKSRDIQMALTENNVVTEFYKKTIINKINKERRSIIGISVSGSYQFIPALLLCKEIRNNCPTVKHIFLGGNYITRLAIYRFKEESELYRLFDSIVLYDGEEILPELFKRIEQDERKYKMNNVYFTSEGKLIKNKIIQSEIVNDSVPNFDGFSLNKYFMPELVLPLYTSRQCFNRCAFCTIPNATSGKYRTISIDRVFEIMKTLSNKYNTRIFSFVDETFEANRMVELSELILSSGIKCFWHGETRFDPNINDENCKKLFLSGCRQIQFGLESYNQRVLDKMKKNIKVDWIKSNIYSALKNNIPVHMFFMVGFPTETKDEALNSIIFTSQVLKDSVNLYNNPYSSRGFQEFGLDIGSDVWKNPKNYCISSIDMFSRGDLSMNLDYEITSGLTSRESVELVNKYQYEHQSEKLFSEFNILPKRLHVSEITWILDSIHNVEYHGNKEEITKYRNMSEITSICWEKNVYCTDYIDESGVEYKVLYNCVCHRTIFLKADIYRDINRLFMSSIGFKSNYSDDEISYHIFILEYFDFLKVKDKISESSLKSDTIKEKLILNQYYKIKKVEGENHWYLFNTITHEMCKLSFDSLRLLRYFVEPISIEVIQQISEKKRDDFVNVTNLISVLRKINILLQCEKIE